LRKIAKMSEENYDVSIPCTHPELKKYSSTVKKNNINCAVSHLKPEKSKRQYEKCYSDFETDVTKRM
jgi:hypothetical protein